MQEIVCCKRHRAVEYQQEEVCESEEFMEDELQISLE